MASAAIVLAAGAGTRMKSTKPKVAHEIFGKPLVRWVIDAAHQAGITQIVSVIGHGKDQVEPLVADTTCVVQEDQLGTAHAVQMARSALAGFEGSVVVLTGDSPLVQPATIQALIAAREQNHAAVAVLTMELENPHGYGRIVRDDQGLVARIVEQKDCNAQQAAITECNSGFYCFDAAFLFDALTQVSANNAQGEYYLTDVIELAYRSHRGVQALVAEDPQECLGVNSRLQLSQAARILQQRINEFHLANGVSILDPAVTYIGPDVRIEPDVEILPFTFLQGTTRIATGSVVGPMSRLSDTTVGQDCVLDGTIAVESQIDNGVTCGPRAYLRAGTHLCDGSKVGTHVEIKKSVIGSHSKVPHLSYIGDATLGEHINIGAGTITCNFDGEHKHQTIVHDNVFVGSDVMLVAPVTIGEGAVIGAGSVITQDVSAGALGLGRARQSEVPHWKEQQEQKKQNS